jgi:sugar phosphate isomerase/epimerase
MKLSRREYLARTATALANLALVSRVKTALADSGDSELKIGMCDWSLGCRADVTVFKLAQAIGLDGIEASLGSSVDNLTLRCEKQQQAYLAAARQHKVAICSIAMGVLNHVPLMSEPRAALWVDDTIEVARALGAKTILLPFFAEGELKEENKDDMRRVIEVLKELAPRAKKAGVVLGLENYLRAEANLQIIEAVESPAVQVYYDFYNLMTKGIDLVKDVRLLGRKNICQLHFKQGAHLLGGGGPDWPAIVEVLNEIEYDGWLVLETACPNDRVTDSRKNMEYLRRLFSAKAAARQSVRVSEPEHGFDR